MDDLTYDMWLVMYTGAWLQLDRCTGKDSIEKARKTIQWLEFHRPEREI